HPGNGHRNVHAKAEDREHGQHKDDPLPKLGICPRKADGFKQRQGQTLIAFTAISSSPSTKAGGKAHRVTASPPLAEIASAAALLNLDACTLSPFVISPNAK